MRGYAASNQRVLAGIDQEPILCYEKTSMNPMDANGARNEPNRAADWRVRVVGKDRLCQLALEAARQAEVVCFPTCSGLECPHLCPPTMVPLLTYFYALGVYGSRAIEELLGEDENARFLCSGKSVDTPRIRYFRRLHRPAIQQCLAEVFRRSHRELMNESAALSGVNGGPPGPSADAGFWQEAKSRIDQAVQIDSMDLDV
jgi:hypothetical protein